MESLFYYLFSREKITSRVREVCLTDSFFSLNGRCRADSMDRKDRTLQSFDPRGIPAQVVDKEAAPMRNFIQEAAGAFKRRSAGGEACQRNSK